MMSRRRAKSPADGARPAHHHAFLTAHASALDMLSAQREARAGLAVLRLVDRIKVGVPREQRPTPRDLRAARRRAIADVEPASIRDTLDRVLDAVTDACTGARPFVAVRLMAYGRVLLNDSRWVQAGDVYQTFISHAATPDDFKWVSEAYRRLAYALRMQGLFDGAAAACRMGQAVAASLGDIEAGLRLKISGGRPRTRARQRQRRGRDARRGDRGRGAARPASRARVRGPRPWHDRLSARPTARCRDAVLRGLADLRRAHQPRPRVGRHGDACSPILASAIRARDAFLIISGTTVEPETRMVAMLNLLELAAKDGHETAFEQYRQALARERLPARIHARYYLTLAKGWERLGRPADAESRAPRRPHRSRRSTASTSRASTTPRPRPRCRHRSKSRSRTICDSRMSFARWRWRPDTPRSIVPELPDVVVYLERLTARNVGQPLERLRILNPFVLRSVSPPTSDADGRRVTGVRRIGKRIVLALEGDLFIVIHLMIAGRLRWRAKDKPIRGKLAQAALEFAERHALPDRGRLQAPSVHQPGLGRSARSPRSTGGGSEPLTADLETFSARLCPLRTIRSSARSPIRDCSVVLAIHTGARFCIARQIVAADANPAILGLEEIERLYNATRETLSCIGLPG